MQFETCCEHMDLTWRSHPVADRYADMYLCRACGHIHKMESWLVPLYADKHTRCANCGGRVAQDGARRRSGDRCKECGMTDEEAHALHDRLAALHPTRDFIQAALAASDAARHVLSLKLATAELHWGRDAQMAHTVRLQALQGLQLHDRALDEAWVWAERDAPAYVWGIIADLEADAGNVEGSLQALEKGLEVDHTNLEMWMDYAELLLHIDSRPHAVEAAAYGFADPRLRGRAFSVLAAVAERYYAEGQFLDALRVCSAAGDYQSESIPLAWIRAQIAASEAQQGTTLEWLEVVLHLDPNHQAAREAYERLNPSKRRGWFGWKR